jgi:hypothetical protein
MIARLILFLFFLGFASAPVGYLGWRLLRPLLQPWRDRRRGMLNASLACSICGEATIPQQDQYDPRHKHWTHSTCLFKLLNDLHTTERKDL